MKNITALQIAGLMVFSTTALCNQPSTAPKLTPEQEYEIFTKDGLPVPGSGVHIIPLAKMKSANFAQERTRINTLATKGYIKEYNSNAIALLTIRDSAKKDIAENKDNTNPSSTHLHQKLEDLKVAYDFQAVPASIVQESIGFAAVGTFIPEKGWTGGIQFFQPKGISSAAMCSYQQSNIQLTGGAANLAEELVVYKVNSKPTIIEISGNNASGYNYTVEWYDDHFRHILNCADKSYSKSTTDRVIELAKRIDANVA